MNYFRKSLLCSCQSSCEDLIKYVCRESGVYNHSGDDGKEDPPVPIPNTEVKLFYAESTYG